MTRPIPPGWHPDPDGSGRRRYFDGHRWGPFEPLRPPLPQSFPAQQLPMQTPVQRFSMNWTTRPAPVDDGYSRRSRIVAGLLQLFFGWHGLGRFYLGYYHLGAVQLTLGLIGLLTTAFCFIGLVILVPLTIWVEIEACMMLAGAIRDAGGHQLR